MNKEIVFIENWKNVANEELDNPSLELLYRSVRDMSKTGLNIGFSSNIQTLKTKIAIVLRKVVKSRKSETQFYNDATDIGALVNLYNRLVKALMEGLGLPKLRAYIIE